MVLSFGSNSGSSWLVAVAVNESSPVCATLPHSVTCVLTLWLMKPTSQLRWGGAPTQPGPRSAYEWSYVHPVGRVRSSRTSDEPPTLREVIVTNQIRSAPTASADPVALAVTST